MTIKGALAWSAKKLKKIPGAESDSAILLCEVIQRPKEFIYANPDKKLSAAQDRKYKKFLARREKREPLSYITGKKEFYGFEFLVSPAVLIPRPETETLIDAVLSTAGVPTSYRGVILDIGTGSGAIAVTLAKLLPKARVFASDISPAALAVARTNARRLGAKITFKKSSLISPLLSELGCPIGLSDTRAPIVIIANLPYLSETEWRTTMPEIKKYEPKEALVGGKTGTELYEKLFEEIASSFFPPLRGDARRDLKINPPRPPFSEGGSIFIFLEIGYNQKTAVAKLAEKILKPKKIEFFKDLAGKWRTARIAINRK